MRVATELGSLQRPVYAVMHAALVSNMIAASFIIQMLNNLHMKGLARWSSSLSDEHRSSRLRTAQRVAWIPDLRYERTTKQQDIRIRIQKSK